VDGDFDKAVELAHGSYCWLMPDDDLIVPGGIARVIEICNRGPDAVIVDAEVRTADLTERLTSGRLGFTGERHYTEADANRLLADCGQHLTFVGAAVVRRELWLSRQRTPYYGSEFLHVGVLFQSPLPGGVIALASWTPQGFIGEMFRLFSKYITPAAGLTPPIRWGDEDHLREIFGSGIGSMTSNVRTAVFRFASAKENVDFFRTYYGPTLRTFEALPAVERESLEREMIELNHRFDLNGGKAGRQGAARHDMLGTDPVCLRVKADQIARTHIDGADRETHRALERHSTAQEGAQSANPAAVRRFRVPEIDLHL
jgi:hypothetical protein